MDNDLEQKLAEFLNRLWVEDNKYIKGQRVEYNFHKTNHLTGGCKSNKTIRCDFFYSEPSIGDMYTWVMISLN